jgi:hypothetical protein
MYALHTISNVLDPIKYLDYITFVLVPYVGQHLIAEDQSCTVEEAYEVMVESRRIGRILHTTDDPEMDDLIQLNERLARREKARVLSSAMMFVVLSRQIDYGASRPSRSLKAEIPTRRTHVTPMVAHFLSVFPRCGSSNTASALLTTLFSQPATTST